MNQLIPISINVNTEAGLASYIQAVNAQPVLSAEEERRLALRYRNEGDLSAARTLVLSQLRAVVRVARKLKGYGLPEADLIQEGNIGLMKAVKAFDPAREVRLVSFAVHWIRAEIYDYILKNWRIVKLATTKAQRKLFFNLRKTRARLGWLTTEETASLADKLNVSTDIVVEMEQRMSGVDIAFDIDEHDDEDTAFAPAQYLEDMRYNPEQAIIASTEADNQSQQLKAALAGLDERARDIITRRWLCESEKPTLHDLAAEYRVSAERIRQIEKKAMAAMKDVLAA